MRPRPPCFQQSTQHASRQWHNHLSLLNGYVSSTSPLSSDAPWCPWQLHHTSAAVLTLPQVRYGLSLLLEMFCTPSIDYICHQVQRQ